MQAARTVNRITLVGNLGRDPDVQTIRRTVAGLAEEHKVAHMSLATNRRLPDDDDGEERHRTDWHRVTFHDELAEFAEQYLRKGDKLFVEGRIEYDSYEHDGVTIPTADVIVQEVVILNRLRGNGADDE